MHETNFFFLLEIIFRFFTHFWKHLLDVGNSCCFFCFFVGFIRSCPMIYIRNRLFVICFTFRIQFVVCFFFLLFFCLIGTERFFSFKITMNWYVINKILHWQNTAQNYVYVVFCILYFTFSCEHFLFLGTFSRSFMWCIALRCAMSIGCRTSLSVGVASAHYRLFDANHTLRHMLTLGHMRVILYMRIVAHRMYS